MDELAVAPGNHLGLVKAVHVLRDDRRGLVIGQLDQVVDHIFRDFLEFRT